MDSAANPDVLPPEPQRARKAILVADVVESVRLMQEQEASFIDRWRQFVNEIRLQVLPGLGGRLVKSLGDGMLLEFDAVRSAVAAAIECHKRAGGHSAAWPSREAMKFRIAVHVDEIVIDDLDIYGGAVNLVARLATLAHPGQTVLSDAARDEIVDGLDGEFEDLGECYLKHLREPVRAWLLRHPQTPEILYLPSSDDLRASIGVMPFSVRRDEPSCARVAEVMADDLTNVLNLQPQCKVISRLTMVAFADTKLHPREIGRLLGVRYLLAGSVEGAAPRYLIGLEVIDTSTGDSIWSNHSAQTELELLAPDHRFAHTLAGEVLQTVMRVELRRWAALPLPNLTGYGTLLGCISSMHRMSPVHCDRARAGLEHLVDRHPRCADPMAWFAKWYMLRTAQGWSDDPAGDAGRAQALIARSLEVRPDHALSLAIDGQIATYLHGNAERALSQGEAAVAANPNEPLGWLYWSHALANAGRSREAVDTSLRALALSPLDPMRYMFDIFVAYAFLVDGQHASAARHARDAVRANKQHQPSYPVLIVSEMLGGHADEARRHAEFFLAVHPAMSLARYAKRHRGTPETVDLFVRVLREAGLPD